MTLNNGSNLVKPAATRALAAAMIALGALGGLAAGEADAMPAVPQTPSIPIPPPSPSKAKSGAYVNNDTLGGINPRERRQDPVGDSGLEK